MESSEWMVTYTRHMTQKRKAYHDGILVVKSCNSIQIKVSLFDDCNKLLDSRFLKKDEKVQSGVTLAFDTALVDIVDMIKTDASLLNSNSDILNRKLTNKERYSRKSLRPPGLALELENSIVDEPGPLQNDAYAGNLCMKEWYVTYTNQKTKRTKKYFDGSLKLMCVGEKKQVILASEDGNILERKYLRYNDEAISTNDTLELEGYLVEVLNSKIGESSINGLPISMTKTGYSKICNFKATDEKDVEICAPHLKAHMERIHVENCHRNIPNLNIATTTRRDVNQILTKLGKLANKNIKPQAVATHDSFPNETIKASMNGNDVKHTHNIVHASKVVSSSVLPIGRKRALSARGFQAPKVEFNASEKHLTFPKDCTPQKLRKVFIANNFPSFASYRNTMTSAVYEEINLVLSDMSDQYHKAMKQLSHINRMRPSCKHGVAKLQVVKKDGPNKGKLFYACPSAAESCLFAWINTQAEGNSQNLASNSSNELEHDLGCFNIDLYKKCEIFLRSSRTSVSSKRRRDDGTNTNNASKTCTYLRLPSSRNQHKSFHSKGDLWIISSNQGFNVEKMNDFVAIGVSQYHCPSSDGILEVILLEGKPPTMPFYEVYALRGPSILCELAMLDVFREMNIQAIPLLPLLMEKPLSSLEEGPSDEATRLADSLIKKYQLNDDQAKVLKAVAKWFSNSKSSNLECLTAIPQICLVHGIFGSGKSFLLTILVIFLTSLGKGCGGHRTRILISAATNVAVDRILMGLLELGFTDFIRIGSVKRIAEKILPFSVYTSTDDRFEDSSIKELQERLEEASVNGEIEEEIKLLREGKVSRRIERLKDTVVVGVTCYSTTKPILRGNKFQVCILDECSQMPETLSLLPICQFGCIKLVAVGDPCQLPPALLGGSDVPERIESEIMGDMQMNNILSCRKNEDCSDLSASCNDLRRPLFVRLVKMGYEPIMLKTQYRCHPRLIAVPNKLFYNGKVINGCSETDRPTLLEGVQPLLFLDTCNHGSEVKDSLKSYNNPYEAKIVCELIKAILEAGIPAWQIGVIVFYKSQANIVQELLHSYAFGKCRQKLKSEMQISTVDAFQGMEKNIIILSCCRTSGLGFLSSPNRLNVALTRARNHLLIIGRASALKTNKFWRTLLEYCTSTIGSYVPAHKSNLEKVVENLKDLTKDPCKTPLQTVTSGHDIDDPRRDSIFLLHGQIADQNQMDCPASDAEQCNETQRPAALKIKGDLNITASGCKNTRENVQICGSSDKEAFECTPTNEDGPLKAFNSSTAKNGKELDTECATQLTEVASKEQSPSFVMASDFGLPCTQEESSFAKAFMEYPKNDNTNRTATSDVLLHSKDSENMVDPLCDEKNVENDTSKEEDLAPNFNLCF